MALKTPNCLSSTLARPFFSILVAWALAAGAAPRAVLAATSAPVGILLTPHNTFRQVVADIRPILEKAGHRCVVVELPKPAEPQKDGGRKPPTDPETTPQPLPESAAIDKVQVRGPMKRPPQPPPESAAIDKVIKQLADAKPAVIVAVGTAATSRALDDIPNSPVIFCMVPNVLDAPFMALDSPHKSRLAGVTTDLSPSQQIDWIIKLAPLAKNIGLLLSPHSQQTANAIKAKAQTRGITITTIQTSKTEFIKAIDTLSNKQCDGVLMIPDARVYNSAAVQRLLLWGIRNKKPVWTFSANIVKAGAFAGQYSDSQFICRQTAELVKKVLSGSKVSKIGLQYPHRISTSANERTAGLIGLPLSSEVKRSLTALYEKDQ